MLQRTKRTLKSDKNNNFNTKYNSFHLPLSDRRNNNYKPEKEDEGEREKNLQLVVDEVVGLEL